MTFAHKADFRTFSYENFIQREKKLNSSGMVPHPRSCASWPCWLGLAPSPQLSASLPEQSSRSHHLASHLPRPPARSPTKWMLTISQQQAACTQQILGQFRSDGTSGGLQSNLLLSTRLALSSSQVTRDFMQFLMHPLVYSETESSSGNHQHCLISIAHWVLLNFNDSWAFFWAAACTWLTFFFSYHSPIIYTEFKMYNKGKWNRLTRCSNSSSLSAYFSTNQAKQESWGNEGRRTTVTAKIPLQAG